MTPGNRDISTPPPSVGRKEAEGYRMPDYMPQSYSLTSRKLLKGKDSGYFRNLLEKHRTR